MQVQTRVLGLGNEILGDDAVGILTAKQVAARCSSETVEVVCSSEAGLHLLDYVTDVSLLIVIDSIETGQLAPGTIIALESDDVRAIPGATPRGAGLFDALALARELGYRIPDEVIILAVEAADEATPGSEMHDGVAAAIPEIVDRVVSRLVRC